MIGGGSSILLIAAGCTGRGAEEPPSYDSDDHENHIDALNSEIKRRDVMVEEIELQEEVVAVSYHSDNINQDLAEVAMSFVERIQGGWGIDRLEAVASGESEMTWHVESEWAEQYLDEEIDAEEYGGKINDTVEHVLLGGGDDGLDGVDSDGD